MYFGSSEKGICMAKACTSKDSKKSEMHLPLKYGACNVPGVGIGILRVLMDLGSGPVIFDQCLRERFWERY